MPIRFHSAKHYLGDHFFRFSRKIKGKLEYQNIFKNFGFLSIVQITNYILPLVVLPYLFNVFGDELFGQLMFAQAFAQYFIIVIDYGFNLSATKEVSLHRLHSEKVSEIFCSVIFLKMMFFFLSFAILLLLVFTVDKFSEFRMIYVFTFLTSLGSVLLPTWLFQGLEKMKYITIVNLTSKIASTLFIFILIKRSDQLILVPIVNSVASILPGVFILLYLNKIFTVQWIVPSKASIWLQLANGWFVFLSSISTSMYTITNTFLLGLMFNASYAGYFSFAEKIIRSITSLFIPLNNALFPFMSLKMKSSPTHGLKIFKKIFIVILFITTIGAFLVYFSSDLLVVVVNKNFGSSIIILKILAPLIVIIPISNLIGFQILFTSGMEKKYLLSVFLAGLLNITIYYLLSGLIDYKSAAVSLLLSEIFVCMSFLKYLIKYNNEIKTITL